MDIVTIDFETYYDQEYSLSKMTTEAYVRDPRFEVICVGVKVNDMEVDVYSGDNLGKFLRSLDYSNKAILCHHTAFDGAILSWHFGINPKLWLDTLSMSRPKYKMTVGGSLKKLAAALGCGEKGDEVILAKGKRRHDFTTEDFSKYKQYCANDVDITYKIFKKLSKDLPAEEIIFIDQIIRMFTEPALQINKHKLMKHIELVLENKKQLMDKLSSDHENVQKILSSNPMFAKLLTSLSVPVPMKISPRTGKETYALAKTDKGFIDLLEHPEPVIQALASARTGVKSTIEETRAQALIEVSERGLLPVYLNYYGAHTGRLSGGDGLNLQNLPARAGKAIRQAIEAVDGQVLVVSDLSQIEARLVAYIAGQNDLVQAFREGRDVYSEFATKVYNRTITKENKLERFVGKTCILGLGYGMGAEKLKHTLSLGQGGMRVNVSLDDAREMVYIYRNTYPSIADLWRIADKALRRMLKGESGSIGMVKYDPDGIILSNNMYIRYPGLRQNNSDQLDLFANKGYEYINNPKSFSAALKKRFVPETEVEYKKIWGGMVVENFTQGQAGILIKEQMMHLYKKGYITRLQVHDEIIISVPEKLAEEAVAYVRKVMSTSPKWAPDLPVACEVGYHKEYGSVVKC